MELYILRHAETDFNKAGIVQGRGVNMPINNTGRLQANLFYKSYSHIAFDAVYASSLIRTQQTIEAFKNHIDTYITDAALDEISWGRFEGLPPSYNFSEQYQRIVKEWTSGNFSARVDGGESLEDVHTRQQEFINVLLRQPFNRVLICTHGRAIRILLAGLLNNNLATVEHFNHHNTGLYILQYNYGVFTATMQNDITHLESIAKYAE